MSAPHAIPMSTRASRHASGVMVAAALAVLAVTIAACRGAAPSPASSPGASLDAVAAALPRANVLLVTIDTLRADHVGAYGGAQGVTPTLDRLAAEGVRVATAHAHVPLTLPSHTALMTGEYPFVNGVRDNGSFRFDGARPTLASALKGAGYRTGAFVSAFVLDARFGLNAGFDVYDDRMNAHGVGGDLSVLERPAGPTLAAAARWIGDGAAGTPWFAWVHLYDAHDPYVPPEPYRTRFAADPYTGEVAAVDAALGAALDGLRQQGALTRTIVVVASDHGESLGEHQERTHGLFAYEATLRVPLLLWAPGALKAGVLQGPARLIDVAPTVLDLVGVSAPAVAGRSMAPAIAAGRPLDPVDVYFEALNANLTRRWAPLTGLIAAPLKYVDLPTAELYDLKADPGETANLFAARQAEANAIARRLFALKASSGPAAPKAVDTETAQRLRSLGYLVTPATAQAGKTYTAADDPKTLIGLDTRLEQALQALRSGQVAAAETTLRALISERPDFIVAHDRLAQLYRDTGRLPKAIATLEASSRAGHADAGSLAALGGYLQEAGNLERSRQVLEAALALNAAQMEIYEKLGVTYTRLGVFDRAHAMFTHMLSVTPDSATTYNNLGSLLLTERRWPEALDALSKAVALDPGLANAYNGRGVAYAQQGRFAEAIVEWRKALELRPDLRDARDNIQRAQDLMRR